MIPRLSPEMSTKIASVVEQSFLGETTKSASLRIAEAATEAGLTVDQTKRACEAYNVTASLSQLKQPGMEKLASFELADFDKVAAAMYPEGIPKETPAFKTTEAAYDLGSFVDQFDAPLQSFSAPENITFDSVYSRIKRANESAAAVESRVDRVYNDLLITIEGNLNKMASMVDGIYGLSVEDIEDPILNGAVKEMISKSASTKPKSDEDTYSLNMLVDETNALMKQAGILEQESVKVKQITATFKKEAANALETYQQLGPSSFRPLLGLSASDPFTDSIMGGLTAKDMPKILENYDYNPYDDPAFVNVSETRDALKHAVTLSDLMKNDEVLSKADPKKVINSFNSVFSTMPGYFDNPELARAALRYHVEYGGLDLPTMTAMSQKSDKAPTSQSVRKELSEGYSTKSREASKSFQDNVKSRQEAALKIKDEKSKKKLDARKLRYDRNETAKKDIASKADKAKSEKDKAVSTAEAARKEEAMAQDGRNKEDTAKREAEMKAAKQLSELVNAAKKNNPSFNFDGSKIDFTRPDVQKAIDKKYGAAGLSEVNKV